MPEQIFALSQIAGWGHNIKNLGFQFLDLAMFLISGKELGVDTGIELLDKERSLTEFWADMLSYYGLWNPNTYQEPTVIPSPDGATAGMEGSTDLMVPDVPAGNSGGIMIPIPEQAGNGMVPAPAQVDVNNGLGGQGQGEGGSKLKIEEVIPPGSTHPVKVYTDRNAQINTGKIEIYIRGKVELDVEATTARIDELKGIRKSNPENFTKEIKKNCRNVRIGYMTINVHKK